MPILVLVASGLPLHGQPAAESTRVSDRKIPLPDTLFVEERSPLSLYLDSLLPDAAPSASVEVRVNHHADKAVASFDRQSRRIDIDTGKVDADDRLDLVIDEQGGPRGGASTASFALKRARRGQEETVRILLLGDSITNRGLGAVLGENLASLSYRPEFVGTVLGRKSRDSQAPAVMGEGREGWAFSDFVHSSMDPTVHDVLRAEKDDTSYYLSLDNNARSRTNPFLRAAGPSDDPSLVRNGLVFDLQQYFDRFDIGTPDVVIIGLGTNDIRKAAMIAPDRVEDGLTIMRKAIRKAAPRARIGVWMPAIARTDAMARRWSVQLSVIRRILDWKRAVKDPLIDVIPVWAQMDRDTAWLPDRRPSAPAPSGPDAEAVRDPIHPSARGLRQIAEPLAAYIASAAGRTR